MLYSPCICTDSLPVFNLFNCVSIIKDLKYIRCKTPISLISVLTLISPFIFAQTPLSENDLAVIESTLHSTLDEITNETTHFIDDWEDKAGACEKVEGGIFGNLRSSCMTVRAALRRGTILQYKQACFERGAELALSLQPSEYNSSLEKLFIAFENTLVQICSLDVDNQQYPAFVTLHTKAVQTMPGAGFDRFGPADSMAWWGPGTDPSYSYPNMNTPTPQLPAILNQ